MAFGILMPGRAIEYLAKRFCRVIPVVLTRAQARYGFFEGGISALDNGLVHDRVPTRYAGNYLTNEGKFLVPTRVD